MAQSPGSKRLFDEAGKPLRYLTRRFYQSLGILVAVLLTSTIGFMWLGRDRPEEVGIFDALWSTLNLVSTVGSLDELSDAERAWSLVVIIFGLGATLYGFGNLSALLTSGEILHVFERRKMTRQIEALEKHVVICGFGNTGLLVAENLSQHRVDFVIIEKDADAAQLARERGYLVIQGDCTQEHILEQSGVASAKGLVAALDSDASNVFVVLTARGLNDDLHIVSRANLPHTTRQLERAGANRVTVPSQIAAQDLATAAVRPQLGDFMTRARRGQEVELIEVRVSDYPWMDGQNLRQLNLSRRADLIIFAIVPSGGAQIFNPEPDTVVNIGDLILAVASRGARKRLRELQAT